MKDTNQQILWLRLSEKVFTDNPKCWQQSYFDWKLLFTPKYYIRWYTITPSSWVAGSDAWVPKSWTLVLVHWTQLTKFASFKQLHVKEPLVRVSCLLLQYNKILKSGSLPTFLLPPHQKSQKSTALVRLATVLSRCSISISSPVIALLFPGYSACINCVFTHR